MPLGCSHAQSRVKLILIASTSKINISGHPTGASGIEFHYKGPDISYLLNTEEERKLTTIMSDWPITLFAFFQTTSTLAVRYLPRILYVLSKCDSELGQIKISMNISYSIMM